MNDRIKELEKLATTVVEGWSDESGTTRYYEFNREKFAELIIRECAEVASDYDGACYVGEAVTKHFGVTE